MENIDQKIDDGVYLKKDKLFRYRLIYPIKNSDGSWNWFNILTGGSWGNLIATSLVIAAILFSVWAYKHDTDALIQFAKKCIEMQPNINSGMFGAKLPNLTIVK